MGSKKIQKITPFVINKREVNGGIYNKINTEFTGGVEIGSYHLDNYAELDTAVLQSPITNTWVGGHTHRHVPLNIGNDEASNRPEAWHIEFDNITNPNNPTITFHSYEYLNSPSALFTREEYAKRPLNIKNIKQNSLGNFKHNYEVLQTSGRRIANNLIADGFIAGGVLTTQFITGSHNYSLPVLNSESGSKSVIVERFNAPGSKEESSRGALDREGEEMSSNISLPWRNYKIRQPFYSQLSQSTPQFGTSIHGVHRNTLPASGSRNEENDNGFVNRPIPRTDIQYSWITASSTTTAGELGGYQAIAFGELDIEFISGSEIVVDNTKYIIDNLGISSLIKDKKQLDLDAKTVSYSSDIGMSASFGELTHSPYSFTTWNSLRTGEHPISRALRKNNIISVQARLKPEEIKTAKLPYDGVEYNRFRKTKRSATSLNFSEPAVTFKYKPLKTKVRLAGAPEGSEQVIVHTFTNNIGNFANEELRIETGLEEKERSEQFYDFLRSTYTSAGAAGNPVAEYLGYQYSEVVWPREENTGLSRTRKREAYILDQPGFDRDGYDRQLGTQRVFWRDNQEDRKRSRNSEGGYYSSMNYLSTEETGSDFVQFEEGVSITNKFFFISSSFITSSSVDIGLYNSIILLENNLVEKDLFYYTASVENQQYLGNSEKKQLLNSIFKKGHTYDISGEFNTNFIDFYEQQKIENIDNKKSVGSLYRNSMYKSLLTSLSINRTLIKGAVSKTEDDEIFLNPKLRYVSFIGGAELNTGSFIQNEENFTNNYKLFEGIQAGQVEAMAVSGSDLYIGGRIPYIDDLRVNNIAKYDTINRTWSSLGNGFDGYVTDITISGSYIVVVGYGFGNKGVQLWDTTGKTGWTSLGLTSTFVSTVELSGSDIYVGGSFTNAGGDPNADYLAKWDGSSWSSVTSTALNDEVKAIAFSGSDIYVGGRFTDAGGVTTADYIAKWNGTAWQALHTDIILDGEVQDILVSGSDFYIGGSFDTGSINRIYKYDGTSASALDSGLSGASLNYVSSLFLSGSSLYVSGRFENEGKNIAMWDTLASSWSNLSGGLDKQSMAITGIDNKIYIGGLFTETGSLITSWNTTINDFEKIYISGSENYNIITDEYFSQTFNKSDFKFSTLDSGLKKVVINTKTPFDDSYKNFIKNIYAKIKDYSILPEFKITDNIKYYIKDNSSNFRTTNSKFLSLDGAQNNLYNSSLSETSSYNNSFFNSYSTSDLSLAEKEISTENKELSQLKKINLKIEGIKKLVPYNGFYPEQRTVQLGNLYNDYISDNLHGGVYSLSYINDFFTGSVVSTDTTTEPNSISVCSFDDRYYMAVGYKDTDTKGVVKIYRTEDNNIDNWSSSVVASITSSFGNFDTDFGSKVELVSASNGLNLFINSKTYETTSLNGFILLANSFDGQNWSEPRGLRVDGTNTYISGSSVSGEFGLFFDTFLENQNGQEKLILTISEHDSSYGKAFVVTGNYENGDWAWSEKKQIESGLTGQDFSSGISFVSCSSGYQIILSQPQDNSNRGGIFYITSSNGWDWSNKIRLYTSAVTYSKLGHGGIKAVNYNEKTYVFFGEPRNVEPYEEISQTGGIFVISSSVGNQWPLVDTDLPETLLYANPVESDYNPFDNSVPEIADYKIQAFSANDGRLYYSVINRGNEIWRAEIFLGNIDQQENWQKITSEEKTALLLTPYDGKNTIKTLEVSSYSLGEFQLPVFFTNIKDESTGNQNISAIRNNLFTDFTLKVSSSEKAYKHAALEPIMAPGILYNTIKSGLAVDWPCATGSNTAIQPYGDNTIVNAYYPKAFEMANFSGSNIYESLYGHLRSNIEYRVPFENIIFPGEAFPVRDFLAEDLVRRTVLTTLPDNDPLVEFINGAYIYGGYEPYISPIDFSDINNLGPKRFSVPFVYRKAGSQDSGLYTLAMSNFLAETVKFFLKDEKMTTFVSEPDYRWKEFNSSKTYYMDIVLEKSPDLVMMEAYHSDLHPTGSNGEKMNGRYFGYPINKTDKAIWGEEDFTAEEKRLIHNDPAYAPYTPPYFEGVARARIAFKPQTSGKYTLQEVFDNATVENIFVDIAKGATTGSDAYVNAMPINSSIDIFGSAQAVEVTIDETSGEQTVRELQDSQNWIISPRMETPVLDFSSQELTPYENNYSKTGGFGRGMWSGYGSIPTNGKGIKVRLEDPFATRPGPNTGSLLNQVGLKPEERNVGAIADTKLISEAVVVIPYLDQNTRNPEYSTDRKNKTGFEFIKISKKLFNKQLSNYRKGKPAISPGDVSSITLEEVIQDTSITEMIEKMEKYVIPPEMNFLEYTDIDPFVMYIFEFEHVLDQEDLKDIWQGLMPKISYTSEEDSVSISHDSAPYEFFEGKEIPENLRWMVFKVKRKAEYNYFNVTSTTKDDTRFNFNKIIGRKEGTDVYSYNWPYDFFSLVEFAKVELMLDYKKKEE